MTLIARGAPLWILLIRPVYGRMNEEQRAIVHQRLMVAWCAALDLLAESMISASMATERMAAVLRGER